jgi:hypothetical protein
MLPVSARARRGSWPPKFVQREPARLFSYKICEPHHIHFGRIVRLLTLTSCLRELQTSFLLTGSRTTATGHDAISIGGAKIL